jgi:hypothetical protein
VDIVKQMVASVQEGKARVQQMIMGAGLLVYTTTVLTAQARRPWSAHFLP